jgi:hypothetical protein
MNIEKKLKVVDLLFSTLEGEELTEDHLDRALASLVRNPLKREKYKRVMIEKYGENVFKNRASEAGKASWEGK